MGGRNALNLAGKFPAKTRRLEIPRCRVRIRVRIAHPVKGAFRDGYLAFVAQEPQMP